MGFIYSPKSRHLKQFFLLSLLKWKNSCLFQKFCSSLYFVKWCSLPSPFVLSYLSNEKLIIFFQILLSSIWYSLSFLFLLSLSNEKLIVFSKSFAHQPIWGILSCIFIAVYCFNTFYLLLFVLFHTSSNPASWPLRWAAAKLYILFFLLSFTLLFICLSCLFYQFVTKIHTSSNPASWPLRWAAARLYILFFLLSFTLLFVCLSCLFY